MLFFIILQLVFWVVIGVSLLINYYQKISEPKWSWIWLLYGYLMIELFASIVSHIFGI